MNVVVGKAMGHATPIFIDEIDAVGRTAALA
jgi:ATP-dependent 26S proteasome regulatory subunit